MLLLFFCMVGSPFVMVGIDFASLVHPCLVFLCKKSGNHLRWWLSLFCFKTLGCFVIRVGIGIASLVHPWLGLLCKKSATTYGACFNFLFPPAGKQAFRSCKKKIRKQLSLFPDFLRRGRDSNPRYLSVRRFSRPVQSTTLPPLQRFLSSSDVVFFV